jgi:hypothetical protein
VKFSLILFFYLFFGFSAISQVNLQPFISVYNKDSLSEAKKSLRTIPNFQIADSIKVDTLIGNIKTGKVKAYIRHNKINVVFSFTDETLYKTLYKQAAQKFKYTTDYARGTRGNGTSRSTTSFSNYEGAKIGSLEVLLVVVRSTDTEKVIRYELLLFPYHED